MSAPKAPPGAFVRPGDQAGWSVANHRRSARCPGDSGDEQYIRMTWRARTRCRTQLALRQSCGADPLQSCFIASPTSSVYRTARARNLKLITAAV